MFIMAVRTVFIYIFLAFFMRLSGKRQVGQLQLGELVTALLLSELAAFPIADRSVPLLHGLIPVMIITLLEIAGACLCALFPKFKKATLGSPAVLIANGKLNQEILFKNRISPDELMAQLRLKGVSELADVDYAILEQNGQLSVILKAEKQPLTAEDAGIKPQQTGLCRPLVMCGVLDRSNMQRLNLSETLLRRRLGKTKIKDILLYTVNDGGEEHIILRDKEL